MFIMICGFTLVYESTQKARIQIWLFEQKDLRIEGRIIVSFAISLHINYTLYCMYYLYPLFLVALYLLPLSVSWSFSAAALHFHDFVTCLLVKLLCYCLIFFVFLLFSCFTSSHFDSLILTKVECCPSYWWNMGLILCSVIMFVWVWEWEVEWGRKYSNKNMTIKWGMLFPESYPLQGVIMGLAFSFSFLSESHLLPILIFTSPPRSNILTKHYVCLFLCKRPGLSSRSFSQIRELLGSFPLLVTQPNMNWFSFVICQCFGSPLSIPDKKGKEGILLNRCLSPMGTSPFPSYYSDVSGHHNEAKLLLL